MLRPLRFVAASALALALAAPALAQTPAPAASSNPQSVQGGAYKIEPVHTRVLFAVSHLGFTTWYGDFTGASGTLQLDPADLSRSRLEVSVPTASVSTTNAKLDGELKGPDWFDAAGVNPLDKAYTVGFEVSGKIRRSEFGVTKYVPMVGDEVELIISAAFEKAGS